LGLALAASLCLAALTPAPANAGKVNLYSYRQPFLIRPLLDAFTEETGIEVRVVFAKQGMVEKILAAGENSPADAVLTSDIGRLDALQQADLLEPIRSDTLDAHVPAHLRHPDGLWFGLTTRARVIWAHRERVVPDEVHSLSDLTDPKFRGRLCMRSGKNAYNIGLFAALIAREGEAAAEDWLQGLKANLARRPQGNDRAQAKAIHTGVCDLALANHYYAGKMATNDKKPEQKEWAESLRVVFLDQDGPGQHVNVSGAGVIRSGRNRANAVRLIEFLIGEKAQQMYAHDNFEYPVRDGVALHPLLESWGRPRLDTLSLERIARLREAASRMVDRVGFDSGP